MKDRRFAQGNLRVAAAVMTVHRRAQRSAMDNQNGRCGGLLEREFFIKYAVKVRSETGGKHLRSNNLQRGAQDVAMLKNLRRTLQQ